MDIPTPLPQRFPREIVITWLLQLSLLALLLIQAGCENKSGITETGQSPIISVTRPANNAIEVAVNTSVSVVFNEKMNPSTITDSSFMVKADTVLVEGKVNYADSTATFTPSADLIYGSTYTAVVTTEAQSLSGNTMDSNYEWVFTTVAEKNERDTTAPHIISTNPSDGEKEISPNTAIIATFSELMNRSTINETTFSLKQGETPISGNVTYADSTARLTPSTTLEYGTDYTVTISENVEDTAGNPMKDNYVWSFTTNNRPDETAPQIIATEPDDEQENVSVSTSVAVTFNEPINTESITGSTFFLEEKNRSIPGEYSFSENSVTFTPDEPLAYNTTFRATITTGVEDLAGNNLSSGLEWDFTTGESPDNDPPEVESTSPEDKEEGVSTGVIISVTFSEPMNSDTFDETTFTLTQDGTRIDGEIPDFSGSTARFIPDSDLEYGTTYSAVVTDEVEDLAGNRLKKELDWSFTTETESTPPAVTSTDPADGQTGVPVDKVITATFSEPLNSETVNEENFTVYLDDEDRVSGDLDYSDEPSTITFTPKDILEFESNYSVLITTGVQDLAGNSLAAEVEWNFTTTAEEDTDD